MYKLIMISNENDGYLLDNARSTSTSIHFPTVPPDDDEYLLTLTADLDLGRLRRTKPEKSELLFVLDNGVAMAGRPWEQTQSAMAKVIE